MEEVRDVELEKWLEGNELSINIWKNKYQYEGETFNQWLDRVSNGNDTLRELIYGKRFLFGGRILANRGLQKLGRRVTYSNCYVIGHPEDNIESIFDTAKKLARTYSYGGGCGLHLGKLRPKGFSVNNAAKYSSGSVSFMDLYNITTEIISQNGRRGALMLFQFCNHPDIEEFIQIKKDLSKIQKANISVGCFDDFMDAVKHKKPYQIEFEVEDGEKLTRTIDADVLMQKIAEMAWDIGDPGVLFWDKISNYNLLSEDDEFEYDGVNPCAEEPLPAGGSCLLGSINLGAYVLNPYSVDAKFDYTLFTRDVVMAVYALDEVLDEGLELHPLEEQRESVKKWRQIGLGVLGFADTLVKLGYRYGSKECINFIEKLGRIMANSALRASANLAAEKGAYPAYKKCVLDSTFITAVADPDTKKLISKYGLRNSQLLTCAPTGSISTMIQASGGIEPFYDISFTRKTESLHSEDVYYEVYTKTVEDYANSKLIARDKTTGKFLELPNFILESTAKKLNYHERISVQATWQDYIDASISSTVNLPESATIETIRDIYIEAWEKGCKGITVFRENCRRVGVLTSGNPKEEKEEVKEEKYKFGDTIPTTDNLIGMKRKIVSGCGSLWVNAYFDPETKELREVFLGKGSTGGCLSFTNAVSRLTSLLARKGASVYEIADQLDSVTTCPSYYARRLTKKDTSPGSSCPVALGKVLIDMYKEFNKSVIETPIETKSDHEVSTSPKCPECGADIEMTEGCMTCKGCGYTKC